MRLASITMVRDEADIIEAFARHNLHFVDKMYLVDDSSSDATAEIIRRLIAEGLPIELVDDGTHGEGYMQGARTTALMRYALAEEPWDFVFPIDADEFFLTTERAVLEEDLRKVPSGKVPGFSMVNYFPNPADDPREADPLVRITYAGERAERTIFKACIDGRTGARDGFRIGDGNHYMYLYEVKIGAVLLPRVELAHFSVRSVEQLVGKLLTGRLRHCARIDFHGGFAMTQVGAADSLMQSPTLVPDLQALMEVYEPASAKVKPRPFTERRGAPLRYGHLSAVYPYRRMIVAGQGLVMGARKAGEEVRQLKKDLEKARDGALTTFLRKQHRSISRRIKGMLRL